MFVNLVITHFDLIHFYNLIQAAVEQLVGRVEATITNLDRVDDSLRQQERLVDR